MGEKYNAGERAASPPGSVRETTSTKEAMQVINVKEDTAVASVEVEPTIRPRSLFSRSSKGVALDDLAPLQFSGRFAGGLCADIKRRIPEFYKSDWTDAFTGGNLSKCLASIAFLFFACLAPAVTFGTFFAEATDDKLGVVETMLSSGISGIVYALFSGQPLCILGATGPELAYTAVFYQICEAFDVEFLPARVWQGLWCALFTILIALFDLSALMRHCTRFTEEIFSVLIAIIFIVGAFTNIFKLYTDGDELAERARAFLGTILSFGTFGLAMWCRSLPKTTLMLPWIRKLLANYGVSISILFFTGINIGFDDIGLAKLDMPDSFRPTMNKVNTTDSRDWFVNPLGVEKDFPAWAVFFTAIPALGLAILGYLDQNLTTLLINRKDHNLQKPPGYHLDMFVCGVFVYPICAFLGLPFTHAATVRSMAHLNSLMNRVDVELEGGKKTTKVESVIEQRFTHFAVHVLLIVGLLVGAPALKLVPKSVLFGVFLYMGVTSLVGVQFYDRVCLWFVWDSKEWPQYPFLKKVPRKTLHQFTAFQLLMFVILYGLKESPNVAVVFPFFIGALIYVRKGMGRCFSAETLAALD
jgi:hypothetical protein